MVKITSSDAGPEFEILDENDVVHARLQDVAENNFTYDGEDVKKFKWTFLVSDPAAGQWNGKEIFGDTSQNFNAHPNCKAYSWVTALTGRKYESGEELDTDDLIGMPCRVLIMHKTDREGRVWMRVKEVLPPKAASKAPVPEEAPF
jgi:hypothetical protein